ncbi:wax ester/triacylglycerol synthase family O-acyltransferase [Actinomycetospora sp. C-140]
MAIASVAVFAGPVPGTEEFAAHLAGRIPLVHRYRQKVRRVPLDLGAPVWVDDPRFVARDHVVRVALPAPGGDAELAALLARVMATRLDRDRPLWRYWVVEGLAEGRWALISQIHHCMVDGISGTDLYGVILDVAPVPRPPAADPPAPAPEPSSAELALGATRTLLGLPLAAAQAAGTLLTHPRVGRDHLGALARGGGALLSALWPTRPSSLTGPRHRGRRFALARGRVGDVRTVRRHLGGTFNDVVLAAVTAGFRALLLARGEEPARDMVRTLVPVSTRTAGDASTNNQVSLLLPHLPVELDDPVERLAATVAELRGCKDAREAEAGVLLTGMTRYEPYPLVAQGVRWASRATQRAVVTVATDVPGPRETLYGLGRELLEIIPYVPIASSAQLGVSIMTYRDALVFGLTADESVEDLDVLAGTISSELRVLAALSGP